MAGLIGVVGRQLGYLNPQSIQQAVQFMLSDQEAQKQLSFNKRCYTSFENSFSLQPKSSSQEYSESESSRHVGAARTVNHTGVQNLWFHEVPTRQPPLALGTSKPRRPYGVTSPKA